jgi:hypothetical protein
MAQLKISCSTEHPEMLAIKPLCGSPIYIGLLRAHDNEVRVIVCDSQGKMLRAGNLMGITEAGVTLYGSVTPESRLSLDSTHGHSLTLLARGT